MLRWWGAFTRLHSWGCVGRMTKAGVGVRFALVFQGFRRLTTPAVTAVHRGGINHARQDSNLQPLVPKTNALSD